MRRTTGVQRMARKPSIWRAIAASFGSAYSASIPRSICAPPSSQRHRLSRRQIVQRELADELPRRITECRRRPRIARTRDTADGFNGRAAVDQEIRAAATQRKLHRQVPIRAQCFRFELPNIAGELPLMRIDDREKALGANVARARAVLLLPGRKQPRPPLHCVVRREARSYPCPWLTE